MSFLSAFDKPLLSESLPRIQESLISYIQTSICCILLLHENRGDWDEIVLYDELLGIYEFECFLFLLLFDELWICRCLIMGIKSLLVEVIQHRRSANFTQVLRPKSVIGIRVARHRD